MNKLTSFVIRVAFLASSLSILPSILWAQAEPLVLKLPPTQTNIIAEGMGNAVEADGTLFNATSFNPALLGRAPHMVEVLVLGLNMSDDTFGLINYVQNVNFNPDQDFKLMAEGSAQGSPTGASEVNQGLGDLQSFLNHLTNKALQAGAGLNVSVKIDKHFGFQVYNSTHAFSQLWRGNLSNTLLAIPLDNNSPTAVAQAVTVMQNDIQSSINQFLSPAQQSSISTDITNLKNGTESLDQFKASVSSNLSGVDPNALGQSILNNLTDDMAILTALVYSDTVFMGTYSTEPFSDIPGLTVGGNLKLVNRHISYDRFSFSNSNIGNTFTDNFKQSTTRWGFDLGFLYELPNLPLDFGLSFEDLFHAGANVNASSGSLLAGFVSDPAPTMVNLSASWHPVPGLRVNGDVDDIFSSSTLYTGVSGASRIKLGASYSCLGFLNLRAGFGDQNLSAGLGLMAGFFGLDYSYGVDDLSQAYNHYVQMAFVF